jgi:ABC-type uncharacterized transport system permease subunit
MNGLIVLGRILQLAYAAEAVFTLTLFKRPGEKLPKVVQRLGWACLVLHAAFLVWAIAWRGVDFLFRESGTLVLFGFVVFMFYTVTLWSGFVAKAQSLGLLIVPVSLISFSLGVRGLTLETALNVRWEFSEVWLGVHILLSVLGEAALVVAALLGLLYLLKEAAIRRKKSLPLVFRLPPLEFLERAGARLLEVGFLCLTLGLWVGSYFATESYGVDWLVQPKQMLSLAAWAVYGGLLVLGRTRAFDAKGMALGCVAGFVLLLLVMVGVSVCPVGFHRFG